MHCSSWNCSKWYKMVHSIWYPWFKASDIGVVLLKKTKKKLKFWKPNSIWHLDSSGLPNICDHFVVGPAYYYSQIYLKSCWYIHYVATYVRVISVKCLELSCARNTITVKFDPSPHLSYFTTASWLETSTSFIFQLIIINTSIVDFERKLWNLFSWHGCLVV